MLKWAIQWLILSGLTLFLLGCGPQQVDLTGQTMGTYYSVKYVTQPGMPQLEVIKAEIDRRLEQVNDQMSTYRPHSELSQFNRSRDIGVPIKVSSATLTVINEASRIHRLTDGALDITIGPLVNLWGFGPEGSLDRVPDPQTLQQRLAWVGMDKLQVQPQGLVKTTPELYIDLSSIAKGYGVDQIAEYLSSLSMTNYMVDIGGEVKTRGQNGQSQPWRIAIEKPDSGNRVQEIITPGDMAVATSGDYRNYFEQQGQRYSHTIDPKTGQPIQNRLISVTVLDPSCMTADGFATAFGVLGPEKSLALANQLQMPIFMLVKTDTGLVELYSDTFKPYLKNR